MKFLLKAWWTFPLRKIIGINSQIQPIFRITQQLKLLISQKSELNFHDLFLISISWGVLFSSLLYECFWNNLVFTFLHTNINIGASNTDLRSKDFLDSLCLLRFLMPHIVCPLYYKYFFGPYSDRHAFYSILLSYYYTLPITKVVKQYLQVWAPSSLHVWAYWT